MTSEVLEDSACHLPSGDSPFAYLPYCKIARFQRRISLIYPKVQTGSLPISLLHFDFYSCL